MERRTIQVRGIVQGVGFRPFVYGLASRFNLHGSVRNATGGVVIEVEGDPSALDEFVNDVVTKRPPLARIDSLTWEPQALRGERRFRIRASQRGTSSDVFIAPDVAACPACLSELSDPKDRRYRYPFLNCTNCGPRLTIIEGSPYDRRRTTMSEFVMCRQCREEYHDPTNRRFHAEPTACAECGPKLELLDAAGKRIETGDPLGQVVRELRAGRIGAVKGLGGYHLACDATSASAVETLRRRKQRDEKPFALMVRDLEAAADVCEIGAAERDLLVSPQAPIVLLRRRPRTPVAESVAPGNPSLGLMLPSTPLHHLLLAEMEGVPLVMTSGNRSDEPIVYRDEEIGERLRGIADVVLTHNRRIHVRCDDSVTRVVDGGEMPVRRSRGHAPQPVGLPEVCHCPGPILATGGQLKTTFALGRDRQAFLSHHVGDLDYLEAYRAFENEVRLYEKAFSIRPQWIAHDLHPDYASTRYALERSRREGSELVPVQHHHAHMASCMAENGLDEPVIGVTFDGTGFGTDGTIWGGEFFIGDYAEFRRAAHLRPFSLPGGERAVREPWRTAVSCLLDAGCDPGMPKLRLEAAAVRTIQRMIERRLNSPRTSSMGRLFDAVAALAGVRDRVSYEGQAAMELEWLASNVIPNGTYPFDLVEEAEPDGGSKRVIDLRPLIRAVVEERSEGTPPELIARRFHSTLVEVVAAVCGRLREESGLNAVVLSGGVFMNALLTSEVMARFSEEGFRAYRHRCVPPNDGGLSLGQLAVAAVRTGGPCESELVSPAASEPAVALQR